jgi:hypothetical protein
MACVEWGSDDDNGVVCIVYPFHLFAVSSTSRYRKRQVFSSDFANRTLFFVLVSLEFVLWLCNICIPTDS